MDLDLTLGERVHAMIATGMALTTAGLVVADLKIYGLVPAMQDAGLGLLAFVAVRLVLGRSLRGPKTDDDETDTDDSD